MENMKSTFFYIWKSHIIEGMIMLAKTQSGSREKSAGGLLYETKGFILVMDFDQVNKVH